MTNNIACFILSYEITKGMKSLGPIGLLKASIHSKELILLQIESLKKLFPNSKITVVSGFGHDKLNKKLPNDIGSIVNDDFETKNQAYIIKLILSQYKMGQFSGVFIMNNNTLFNRPKLSKNISFNKSWIIVKAIKKTRQKSKFMGFTLKRGGELEHIYYDIGQTMWCESLYMCDADIGQLKSNLDDYYDNMFLFEVINKSIVNKIKYDPILIASDSHTTISGPKDKHKIKEENYAKN